MSEETPRREVAPRDRIECSSARIPAPHFSPHGSPGALSSPLFMNRDRERGG